MPAYYLDPVETRILGCLLEKERTTPENYPLSPNALLSACNQTTNRDPVVSYDERTVEAGVTSLREKKLAILIHAAGARVQKYRHNLPEHFELDARETALLCVLLLRGPQTPGELRGRTERLAPFNSLEHVEAVLAELAKGDDPLVRILPPQPGQKERRWMQLLSDESTQAAAAAASLGASGSVGGATLPSSSGSAGRIEALESQLTELRTELQQLREEFAAFRKQFE